MNTLDLIHHPWLTWPGLVLVHTLWQGATVGLLLASALAIMPRCSAALRYVSCQVGLAMLLLAPILTLLTIEPASVSVIAPRAEERSTAVDAPPLLALEVPDAIAVHLRTELTSHSPVSSDDGAGLAVAANSGLRRPGVAGEPRPPETDGSAGMGSGGVRLDWLATALAALTVTWVLGITLLTLRLLIGWSRVERLRRRAIKLAQPLEQAAERMLTRFGLLGRAVVLATQDAVQPVAVGLLRPAVLVPVSLITRCPIEHIEALIAHELAHIRRYDLWVNLLQRVVETLFFYHPVVWWVSGRMSAERELCCDDLAVSATGRRAVYATALLEASCDLVGARGPALSVGAFGTRVTLVERVRRTLRLPPEPRRSRFWVAGPLSLALAGAMLGAAYVQASAQAPGGTAGQPESRNAGAVGDEGIPPMPSTSFIETEFSRLNEKLDKRRTRLAMLAPAVAAGRAVHAMRDALYDGDIAELRHWFRPTGQDVAPAQVSQLLRDLESLQVDSRGLCWVVDVVEVAPELGLGLVRSFGSSFRLPHEDGSGKKWSDRDRRFFLAADVERDAGEWHVTRLAVISRADSDGVTERFRATLNKHHDDSAPVKLLSARFSWNDSRLSEYVCYESCTEGDTIDWKKIEEARSVDWKNTELAYRRFFSRCARRQLDMRSWAEGVVSAVRSDVGQIVKKGDVLVELDNAEIRLELQAAKIRLEKLERMRERSKQKAMAEKELHDFESDLALARIDVERWQHRLDRTQIRSPSDARMNSIRVRVGQRVEVGEIVGSVLREESSPEGAAEGSESR